MVSGPVNAVVTTGIYCRDGCPASPLPGNVRTYPVDVGAEVAGFRPCRRCHPERRPPPAAWDIHDIVARALDEVCAGALDRSGEAELARTCGVSARHLRRLFVAHVGATPTQVAVSRRAHFARRLLDETDLPVAQIAFAAGFGSVRTMNATMRRIFRSPPSALRARRSRRGREVADGGLRLTLALARPLAPGFYRRLAGACIDGVEAVAGDSYTRTVSVAGHPGVVRVTRLGPDSLGVEAHLPRFDRLIELAEHVRLVFTQPAAGPPGWTPAEAALKVHGVDRATLHAAAQHWGSVLPVPLLGLTLLNPDYRAISPEDWRSLGVAARAPLPDRFDEVAAWATWPLAGRSTITSGASRWRPSPPGTSPGGPAGSTPSTAEPWPGAGLTAPR